MNYNYQFIYPESRMILPFPLKMQSSMTCSNGIESRHGAFNSEGSSQLWCEANWQMYQVLNQSLPGDWINSSTSSAYANHVPIASYLNPACFAYEIPKIGQADERKAYPEWLQIFPEQVNDQWKLQIMDIDNYCNWFDQSTCCQVQNPDSAESSTSGLRCVETKLIESIYNDPVVNSGLAESAEPVVHSGINESHKRQSNMFKSKINAKFLKNYQCKVEERRNSKGGLTTFYICKYQECNKEFTRTWSILDHVRMHEGVRPYVCKFCSRSYTQKGNMIKHMRRHTEPSVDTRRTYLCEFCGRGYTEKYNLKVQMLILY